MKLILLKIYFFYIQTTANSVAAAAACLGISNENEPLLRVKYILQKLLFNNFYLESF
jgi:hypothetical protein